MKIKIVRTVLVLLCAIFLILIVASASLYALAPEASGTGGVIITTTTKMLPFTEWGSRGGLNACGLYGGTHCERFFFFERCVSTYYPHTPLRASHP